MLECRKYVEFFRCDLSYLWENKSVRIISVFVSMKKKATFRQLPEVVVHLYELQR